MSKFEDPIQFDTDKTIDDVEITYTELMEIVQGGPEVGCLSINGQLITGRYGGPVWYHEKSVYVPAYVSKLFGKGFRLAKINVDTFSVVYLTKIKNLVFIDSIDREKVCFFEDMNKSVRNCCPI